MGGNWSRASFPHFRKGELMKKTVLGGILALSLALASCGGPTTPAPGTGTTPKPAPAPGTVADAPEDATAAREYVFSKRQTRAALQSLGLGQLDAVDLGERLRVVLTVNRAKSGANIGKKKATATFIWGNQTVNLAGTYTLGVGAFGSTGALKATDGKLALAVKSPDFQAKASKSTAYVPDTGLLCARLTFNLGAGPSAWSSNSPVEVCEGVSERNAEEKALTTFSKGLRYTEGSLAGSPWTFGRISDQGAAEMPAPAVLLAARGLPAYTTVKTETFREFVYNHLSIYEMTSKERRAWTGFLQQFNIYYKESKVYRIRLSDERELVYLLGRNSSGVSGVWAYRFHDADGQGDPAYSGAQTYPYVGRYGGSLLGEVQIGPHAAGATVTGRYALRQSGTCSAGAGVTLDKELIQTDVFDYENGLASTKFEIEATPDDGQDVVLDYALTVTYGGQSKTYTGFFCDIKPPPPPAPSVQDVEVGAWFDRSPNMTTEDGRHERAEIWLSRFDGPAPESWGVSWPHTQTAGGTYRIENAPECGAEQAQVLSSGPLTLQVHDYVEMVGYSLALPSEALNNITPHSRFVYSVTVSGSDGTRTIDGARCVRWED